MRVLSWMHRLVVDDNEQLGRHGVESIWCWFNGCMNYSARVDGYIYTPEYALGGIGPKTG